MMNSQALFGDYETVSALNIYELIRPKNADYVSMIAYHWNGKERELIHDEEDGQQESGSAASGAGKVAAGLQDRDAFFGKP